MSSREIPIPKRVLVIPVVVSRQNLEQMSMFIKAFSLGHTASLLCCGIEGIIRLDGKSHLSRDTTASDTNPPYWVQVTAGSGASPYGHSISTDVSKDTDTTISVNPTTYDVTMTQSPNTAIRAVILNVYFRINALQHNPFHKGHHVQ